ncbi:MAG: glycosyltransferase [Rhizobium rhizophilum]|uniref:glycosyltransferase n=1 Tax=Rhizobium rhizophilum TaxID=1850373 RepID=UPI00391B33CB
MTPSFDHIIFAPNVRAGGGLVLLRALLEAAADGGAVCAFLDPRSASHLPPIENLHILWVKPGLVGRLKAEVWLRSVVSRRSRVLCFHGVPPLLPLPAHVMVYAQNALTVSKYSLRGFSLKTSVRLALERAIHKCFATNADEYIVQTRTMRRLVASTLPRMSIKECPFVPELPLSQAPYASEDTRRPSFIFPAHDDPHKNHKNLLLAWSILAQEGVEVELILTVEPSTEGLGKYIAQACDNGAYIQCIGNVDHKSLVAIIEASTALIYPSYIESFGLPLIEAKHLNKPIVASERDFVRDVCEPITTFDPDSPRSIAAAIRRFLGEKKTVVPPLSGAEAWAKLMDE